MPLKPVLGGLVPVSSSDSTARAAVASLSNDLKSRYYLRRAWDKLTAMSFPGYTATQLTVLGFGDSMISGAAPTKFRYLMPLLKITYGNCGNALDGCVRANSGPGAVSYTDYAIWPGSLTRLSTSGDTCEFKGFGYDYNYVSVAATRLKIYYVKEPGAGTFKIQSSSDDGATWSDETGFTSISADNATIDCGIATVTKTLGLYRVRVVWLSGGQVRIVSGALIRTDIGGIIDASIVSGGTNLCDMVLCANSPVFRGVIADVAPNVEIIEFKDSVSYSADSAKIFGQSGATYSTPGRAATTFAQALADHYNQMTGVLPNIEFVGCLSSPVYTPQDDSIQVANNDAMKAWAAARSIMVFDSYSIFGSGATMNALGWYNNSDSVHPSASANAFASALFIDALGWFRHAYSALGFVGKFFASNTQPQGFSSNGATNVTITGPSTYNQTISVRKETGAQRQYINFNPSNASFLPDGIVLAGGTGSWIMAIGKDGYCIFADNPSSSMPKRRIYASGDLALSGGLLTGIRTVTANTTLDDSFYTGDSTLLVDASAGNITITIPAIVASGSGSNKGRLFSIKKIDSSANTVAFLCSGSNTTDAPTLTLLNQCVTIQSNGVAGASGKWVLISNC